MISALLTPVGGRLAERLLAAGLSAAVFWLGGLLCWCYHRGWHDPLRAPLGWYARQPAPVQALSVVALGALVVASGLVVERLTPPLLRLVCGYWPPILAPLQTRLAVRWADRARRADERLQHLAAALAEGTALAADRADFVRLTSLLKTMPGDGRYQATRVGNLLRSAETRPEAKYGLDAATVWPHLWLILPAEPRAALISARTAFDTAVTTACWGLLSVVFTPWAWWAMVAGPAVAIAVLAFWVPLRAQTFALLLEATIDLHRVDLYRRLRWPLPTDPADERRQGRRLTTFLLHGLDGTEPTFVPDSGSTS